MGRQRSRVLHKIPSELTEGRRNSRGEHEMGKNEADDERILSAPAAARV